MSVSERQATVAVNAVPYTRPTTNQEEDMSVAKVTEIISSSSKSFDDAINEGIKRAGKTLENIKGAWVKDQNLVVENDKVVEYRVTLVVTFVLND